jgi:hypothetical protein
MVSEEKYHEASLRLEQINLDLMIKRILRAYERNGSPIPQVPFGALIAPFPKHKALDPNSKYKIDHTNLLIKNDWTDKLDDAMNDFFEQDRPTGSRIFTEHIKDIYPNYDFTLDHRKVDDEHFARVYEFATIANGGSLVAPMATGEFDMRFYHCEFRFNRVHARRVLADYIRAAKESGKANVSLPKRGSKRYKPFYRGLDEKMFEMVGCPPVYGGTKHFNAAKMHILLPYLLKAKLSTRNAYDFRSKRIQASRSPLVEFVIDLQSKAQVYTRIIVGEDPIYPIVSNTIIRKVKSIEKEIDSDFEPGLKQIPDEYTIGQNKDREERYVFVRLYYERNNNYSPDSQWMQPSSIQVIHPKKRSALPIALNKEKIIKTVLS